MKLLFVCSRNQWRSPTAEALFKNSTIHTAKSAGTAPNARTKVSEKLLDWADVVFVMEKRHKQLLQERFATAMSHKKIVVLDIPDDYQYMDPELIQTLQEMLSDYL